MKGKKRGKHLLALVLTLALAVTYSVPLSVFAAAAQGAEGSDWQIVSGTVESEQTNVQEGTVEGQPWKVTTSKTIRPTDKENEFQIDLKVTTTEDVQRVESTNADIVLVLDTSGSMEGNSLIDAKAAAKNFVTNTLTPTATGIRVGLVSFDDKAVRVVGLTDQGSLLHKGIDQLWAGGGTFMQDGLRKANQMLKADNSTAQKFIVLLGDGEPTYAYKYKGDQNKDWFYVNGNYSKYGVADNYGDLDFGVYNPWIATQFGNKYGTGMGTSANMSAETVGEALQIKKSGVEIYSVGCGLGNGNGDKKAKILLQNCSTDPRSQSHYINAENSSSLIGIFQTIQKDIIASVDAWIVSDEMGEFIKLNMTDGEKYGAEIVKGENGRDVIKWNLKSLAAKSHREESKQGNVTTYTYKLTYPITLDTEGVGFAADQTYVTNGPTDLFYMIVGTNIPSGNLQHLGFKIPSITGKLPGYSIPVRYYKQELDEKNQPKEKVLLKDAVATLENVTKGAVVSDVVTSELLEHYYNDEALVIADDYEAGTLFSPTAETVISKDLKEIQILYTAKPKYGYTVEYYKDNTDGQPFATRSGVSLYKAGTELKFDDVKKEITAPETPSGYRFDRVAVDLIQVSDEVQTKNAFKVVYTHKRTASYHVQYVAGNTGETLTTSAITSAKEGDVVSKSAVDTSWTPNEHWTAVKTEWPGEASGETFELKEGSSNIIVVTLKEADKFSYTVKDIKHPTDGDETSGESVDSTTSYYAGTDISLSDLSVNEDKYANYHLGSGTDPEKWIVPANGFSTQGAFAISTDQALNVVNVHYYEDPKFTYTVNYFAGDDFKYSVTSENSHYGDTVINLNGVDGTIDSEHKDSFANYSYSTKAVADNSKKDDKGNLLIQQDSSKNNINVYYVLKDRGAYHVKYMSTEGRELSLLFGDDYNTASKDGYVDTVVTTGGIDVKAAPTGYEFSSIKWPGSDSSSLTIASGEPQTVIVYYAPKNGVTYRVEYYKGDSTKPADTENLIGRVGTKVGSITPEIQNKYSSEGYSYTESDPTDGAIQISSNSRENVIKHYYRAEMRPLTVQYIYGGMEDADAGVSEQHRVGEWITANNKDKTGFILDSILVNGVEAEKAASITESMPNDETGLSIVFNYKRSDDITWPIQHFYHNLTTGATSETGISIAKVTDGHLDLGNLKNLGFDGKTYTLKKIKVSASFFDEVKAAAQDRLAAAKKAFEDLKNSFTNDNADQAAEIENAYQAEIAETQDKLSAAAIALETEKTALGTVRDDEKATAQAIFTEEEKVFSAEAAGMLTTESSIQLSDEELLTLTYGGILLKYDELVDTKSAAADRAQSAYDGEVASAKAIYTDAEAAAKDEKQKAFDLLNDEYTELTNSAITSTEDMDTASKAAIEAQAELEQLQATEGATEAEIARAEEKVLNAQTAYEKAEQELLTATASASAIEAPLATASEELNLAMTTLTEKEAAFEDSEEKAAISTDALEAAKADLSAIKSELTGYKNLVEASQDYSDYQAAIEEYAKALTAADQKFETALEQSEAQKVYDEAEKAAKDAEAKAVLRREDAYRKEIANLNDESKAAIAELSAAEQAAGQIENGEVPVEITDMTSGQISEYEIDPNADYAFEFYYEYQESKPVDPVTPSRPGGGGGGGNNNGGNTENIPDEDVPLADLPQVDEPVDIVDEEVPLGNVPQEEIPDNEIPMAALPQGQGQLPKTGGMGAGVLYGLGALLAGGGLLIRRKEEE